MKIIHYFTAGIFALFLGVNLYGQQMLRNVAFRSPVGQGVNAPTAGFVTRDIPGTRIGAKKTMLIRAVGPTLGRAPFNLGNVSQNPRIELYKGQTLVAVNQGWDSSRQTQLASQQVGAFPLLLDSKDAVIFIDLEAGAYTARVTDSGDGIALIEVYDVSRDADNIELINISARARVTGNGAQAGTVGIVVDGNGPRPILVRVAGPELAAFGITDFMPDPMLTVYSAQGVVLSSNSDWGGSPQLIDLFPRVGAFPWNSASSKGAAILMNTSGTGTVSYTFRGGQENASGIIVIEAYRL